LPWTYRTGGRKLVLIDKSSQWVGLYWRDGKRVAIFRCASGTLYPTLGWHRVYSKQRRTMSLSRTVSMQYFSGFQRSRRGNNVGFHSIPVTRSGRLISGLGKPVSAGCVRLALPTAKQLYYWAPVGTRVFVRW
jgi:lipoprotein-anchoring transpeptidase ErfK/SrfK